MSSLSATVRRFGVPFLSVVLRGLGFRFGGSREAPVVDFSAAGAEFVFGEEEARGGVD